MDMSQNDNNFCFKSREREQQYIGRDVIPTYPLRYFILGLDFRLSQVIYPSRSRCFSFFYGSYCLLGCIFTYCQHTVVLSSLISNDSAANMK